MARIRSLKPEFWTDEKVVTLPFPARLFFMGCWNFARCDHGHLDDNALSLKLRILPADDVDAQELLDALVEVGLLDRYEKDGRSYLHIRNFGSHQKVETRWNTRCPYCSPADSTNLDQTPPTPSQEGLGLGTGKGSGKELDLAFEDFWNTYPPRKGKKLEKGKAAEAFKRLNNSERALATEAVAHYAASCNRGDTLAKDAFRWLRDKAFNDWLTPPESPPAVNPYGERKPNPFDDDPCCEHGQSVRLVCRECEEQRVSV